MVTATSPPTALSAFYSSYLSEEDRASYEIALTVNGLQGEIALLRVQLGHLCHDDPYNTPMFLRLTNAINRLTKTQRILKMDDADQAVDPAISAVESLLSLKRSSERDALPAANGRSRVWPDAMDSRPDQESMVVGANIDTTPSVHSEQTGIDEDLGAKDDAPITSDQDIAVPPPIDVRDILLPPAQAMLLFSHGNGRSKKKNKNHRRH